MTDWVRWHDNYDDPDGRYAHRLSAVRAQVRLAVDRAEQGPVRVLSLCAGDGRDVLPVLAAHPRRVDVAGRLVEWDPRLCAAARAVAPARVEVVRADAGTTASCRGAVPADVLLLCGIFGNVADGDVARTVAAVPSLLSAGGTVVWTRHTGEPDLTPSVRAWFADAGVGETAFVSGRGRGEPWAVGAGVLTAAGPPPEPDRRLFTFVR